MSEDILNVMGSFSETALDCIEKQNEEIENLQQELNKCTGKIKVLEHNCKQAEESCRQHRLSNKNKIRRLKRREEQITKLQQELTKYKERNKNAIEKLEALIVFWKKYNPIDNYMQVEQFKGVISILEDKENINERRTNKQIII